MPNPPRLRAGATSAALLLLAACGSGGGTSAGAGQPGAGAGNAIQIANFSFAPKTLQVVAGTTVTWTNTDSATHTTTANDGGWDSHNLVNGKAFSFKFTTAGTFGFHCNIHDYMRGTVTVTG